MRIFGQAIVFLAMAFVYAVVPVDQLKKLKLRRAQKQVFNNLQTCKN